jgi:hypothetical protein
MLFLLLACTGAGPKPTDTATASDPQLLGPFLTGDCDPIAPDVCGFPFPSNVYLRPDPTTETGARVAFGPTTLPVSDFGIQSSPDLLNLADGFSPAAGPLTYLPGATATGFAGPNSPGDSLLDSSPTIILDADTGERVAHFAELDESQPDDARKAIMLRPTTLLTPGHRYIVAIRNVLDENGAPVAPSDVFRALRDDTASDEPSVDARRDLYDDIFAHLEQAGIPRENLQIAWDFTVASRDNATRGLLAMRDEALAEVGHGATYTFDTIQTDPDASIALRIEGTVNVPLYLDDPGPGGRFVLDGDGMPTRNGTTSYPFVLLVPNSCRGRSCPIVQYGHGLFGDRYSIDQSGYHEAADSFGAVVISMDWIGMSNADVSVIAAAAAGGDISGFASIPDRSQQGMVNLAVALRTLEGTMAEDSALILDGVPVVDPTTRYYVGGSQGGIYGATYMAITPDIERGVLVVPGVAYSLMLPRSVYWTDYATPFIVENFDDPRVVQLVLGYVQMLWDHAEPSGYAAAITTDPFPDTPTHHVLLMEGIGDHQVPNLSTELLARSIGASMLAPANRELFGLDPVEGPLTDTDALLDFDYGLPDVPAADVPMTEGDDPHSAVFFEPGAQASMRAFLTTGTVQNFCDGSCDPE